MSCIQLIDLTPSTLMSSELVGEQTIFQGKKYQNYVIYQGVEWTMNQTKKQLSMKVKACEESKIPIETVSSFQEACCCMRNTQKKKKIFQHKNSQGRVEIENLSSVQASLKYLNANVLIICTLGSNSYTLTLFKFLHEVGQLANFTGISVLIQHPRMSKTFCITLY